MDVGRHGRGASTLITCVLALALTSSAGAADGISVFSHVSGPYNGAPADATHELALNLYTFRRTSWSWREILPALRGTSDILATCGVALTRVELVMLEAPPKFHVYSTEASRELLRSFEAARPAVFFVQDSRNQPAYDAEAIGLANAGARPELVNTIWVAYGARDLPYAIAHELVHVLSDSGEHSDEAGNLMRPETSKGNTALTDTQCARLRERGEANKLVSRRR